MLYMLHIYVVLPSAPLHGDSSVEYLASARTCVDEFIGVEVCYSVRTVNIVVFYRNGHSICKGEDETELG